MKKIMIAFALMLAFQTVKSQEIRTPAEIKSALASAEKASNDAKKAEKVATWFKLGKVNLDAYVTAQGYGAVGLSEQEVQLMMSNEKDAPVSEEVVGGVPMKKVSYSTADYFYQDGKLAIVKITKPFTENALEKSAAAFGKAHTLDIKGQKTKDITEALEKLDKFFNEEAYLAYRFGDMKTASEYFEKAYKVSIQAPLSKMDSAALYNAGFTAWSDNNLDRAKTLFTDAVAINYVGEGGDAYVKLSDIADKQGDKALSKEWLEKGFVLYPESQGILVGLINYYVTSGENTSELFAIIDKAKANEPNNASLFYVEGNVHKNLNEIDEALAAYDKCSVINPNYEYGLIGKGILFYEQALKFQDLASNEMDDAKWEEYNKQFENALRSCIEPFEKAFEITGDASVRKSICEYLKNACFRFRNEDESYMKKYEKYSAAMEE